MKKQLNRIIAGLLVLTLTTYSLKAADTNGATTFQLTSSKPQQQAKPALAIECIAIIITVGIITYVVYRCIEAAGLTNSPAPPPNNSTNSSSIVILPADGPILPPVSTNINIISTTNSAAPAPSVIYFNASLATNNDENVETKWDVSTNGWTDWQGNPYTWLIITHTDPTGPHVQTSTNLTTWTDSYQTVYMWISSTVSPDLGMNYLTNMTTVVYDGNGVSILTNFAAINPNTSVNLGIPVTAPQMFFRGVTPWAYWKEFYSGLSSLCF